MTVKETAGKILLALYSIQTDNPAYLQDRKIIFRTISKVKLHTDAKFKEILYKINSDESALYNAFDYLLQKKFIASNQSNTMGALVLIGTHLTFNGVDIIEGIERGKGPQKVIKSLFNFSFNFSPTMKVDSLIKAEVGNIVGIGGAVSGKVKF